MADYAPDLEARIHHFALAEGRSFDGAARRLLALGIAAATAAATERDASSLARMIAGKTSTP